MSKTRTPQPAPKSSPLMVRLDQESKTVLSKAAGIRGVSVSDYVRMVTVAQAQKEVSAADQQVIALTPEEQLTFWNALNEPVVLSPNQKKLAAIMQGKT